MDNDKPTYMQITDEEAAAFVHSVNVRPIPIAVRIRDFVKSILINPPANDGRVSLMQYIDDLTGADSGK